MHHLRLWLIIPILGLVGFFFALVATTGYLWDIEIQGSKFGTGAQWASAFASLIVVSVTLHLADKGRREAAEKSEASRQAARKDSQEILNTAASLIARMREEAKKVPMGQLGTLENSRIVLKSMSRLLEITVRRSDLSPAKVLRLLSMLEIVERAQAYMTGPFGVSDDDRNSLLDELVHDSALIRDNDFDLRPSQRQEHATDG